VLAGYTIITFMQYSPGEITSLHLSASQEGLFFHGVR